MVSNPMMMMIMADLVLAGVIVVDLVLAMAMMFYSSGRHLAENVSRLSGEVVLVFPRASRARRALLRAARTHAHTHARAHARGAGGRTQTRPLRARERVRVEPRVKLQQTCMYVPRE